MVGERAAWAEAHLRGCVDRVAMKILAVVGTEQGENPCHRKGKGSLAMQISQGLVGPKCPRNVRYTKGNQVNIPELIRYAWQHKLQFRRIRLDVHDLSVVSRRAHLRSIVMMRNR